MKKNLYLATSLLVTTTVLVVLFVSERHTKGWNLVDAEEEVSGLERDLVRIVHDVRELRDVGIQESAISGFREYILSGEDPGRKPEVRKASANQSNKMILAGSKLRQPRIRRIPLPP